MCATSNAYFGIGVELALIFDMSADLHPGGQKLFWGEWGPILAAEILGSNVQNCTKEPGLGIEGFRRRMSTVAASMSNALRTADSSTSLEGEAWVREQYINVEFIWLTMSAVVYVCTTIFLFLTMLEMRHAPL
ncbi:hypothetical protein CC78DRAFT_583543 [Lojkania enalia]|uniref:Uncharacterized protein n=1 Tax=Lojkania enalia TaxID=147567 RepID=A0A9P4N1J1_9PLEO|nr:hypothetical protein CC78DRAFT_583543 [Didymosphaeria enalia]